MGICPSVRSFQVMASVINNIHLSRDVNSGYNPNAPINVSSLAAFCQRKLAYMAFNEKLSDRIREALADVPVLEEKYMFGGICYMVDGKMCIGVIGDEMMCRIGEEAYEAALEQRGCREMVFTGRPMKGYVYVAEEGMRSKKEFDYWIHLCLTFNPKAKAAKKKTSK